MSTQAMSDKHKGILQAFSHALVREAHVLTQNPDLLWQQLFNRLQWEGEDMKFVLAPEFSLRNLPDSKPWIHLATPVMESQALMRTLEGHTELVHASAISPDGTYLLSASEDETVRMWDLATGQNIRIHKELGSKTHGYKHGVEDCEFSPDGRLYAASGTKTMVWDTGNGMVVNTLEGYQTCSFLPNSRLIVTAGLNNTVIVWDIYTGQKKISLKGHTGKVMVCVVAPAGNLIASAGWDKTIRLWDVKTGLTKNILEGHTESVDGCAFSSDGRFLVSVSRDKTIRVWDVTEGRVLHILQGHNDWVHDCSFSPDDRFIISVSSDKTVKIWDTTSFEELDTFIGHAISVDGCAISPDGTWIVTSGGDKNLKIWDARSQTRVNSQLDRPKIKRGETNSEGNISSSEGFNKILDRLDFKNLHTFIWPKRFMLGPETSWILTRYRTNDFKMHDLINGRELHTFKGHDGWVEDCAFSPDGTWIVSASRDNSLKIWDTSTGKTIRTLKGHTEWVQRCIISPDGALILSAGADHTIKVWDTSNGRLQYSLKNQNVWFYECGFSPDAQWIYYVNHGQQIKISHIENGNEIFNLKGHIDHLTSLAVSPDGRLMVSAGKDSKMIVWDAHTGYSLHTLENIRGDSLVFSPDGRFILCAVNDYLKVWDVNNGIWKTRIPFLGYVLAHHFWLPKAYIHQGGYNYLIDMVGIKYGPIIISAVERKQGLAVSCPSCHLELLVKPDSLGNELTCPRTDCGLRLKINPIPLHPSHEKKSLFSALFTK